MFIALGGTLRLLLPASVFASKRNPGSRGFAPRIRHFGRVFPKSRLSARVPEKEKGKRRGEGLEACRLHPPPPPTCGLTKPLCRACLGKRSVVVCSQDGLILEWGGRPGGPSAQLVSTEG